LGLPDERRVRLERELRDALAIEAGATRTRNASRCPLHHDRRLLLRLGRRRQVSWRLATPAWTISDPTHSATSAVTRAGSIVCTSLSSFLSRRFT
jgi:hypothetical protein